MRRQGLRAILALVAVALLAIGGIVLVKAISDQPTENLGKHSVTSTASPNPAKLGLGEETTPFTLTLDRVDVSARIVEATVPDGVLTPPDDVSTVGLWIDGAALDAEEGTTLIAGHVNLAGQGNGALFNLASMQPGDMVSTSDSEGRATSWRVTRVVDRPKADGIEESVLDGPTGPRKLAIVTCGGDLRSKNGIGDYADNVYLYADKID